MTKTAKTATREHGLTFIAAEVRALLAGIQSRTMRVIRNLPAHWVRGKIPQYFSEGDFCFYDPANPIGTFPTRFRVPIQVGDLIWVKETWLELDRDHWAEPGSPRDKIIVSDVPRANAIAYRAECGVESDEIRKEYGYKWRSPVGMPKWAARIWLRMTDVDVERMHDVWYWVYHFDRAEKP